jgi:hypothetical protein
MENVKGDAVAGDRVFDGAELLEGCRKEAKGGIGDFVDIGFAVDFDVWKFPEMRVDKAGWSLANEKAGVSVDNECKETSGSGGSAAWEVWE